MDWIDVFVSLYVAEQSRAEQKGLPSDIVKEAKAT